MPSAVVLGPEQAYRAVKRRIVSLGASPQLSRLGNGQLLTALSNLLGYESFDHAKVALQHLGQSGARPNCTAELAWLVHVLDADMSSPKGLAPADWGRLKEFLAKLSQTLGVKESAMLNAAAIAWCTAPEWAAVEQRRVRYAATQSAGIGK